MGRDSKKGAAIWEGEIFFSGKKKEKKKKKDKVNLGVAGFRGKKGKKRTKKGPALAGEKKRKTWRQAYLGKKNKKKGERSRGERRGRAISSEVRERRKNFLGEKWGR